MYSGVIQEDLYYAFVVLRNINSEFMVLQKWLEIQKKTLANEISASGEHILKALMEFIIIIAMT